MLPDLPAVKRKLLKVQMDFVQNTARELMPAFGECQTIHIFEGNQQGVERATGDTDIRDLNVASAEVAVAPHKDDLGTVFSKLHDMARQFAEQFEKKSFQHLNEVLDQHGQTADAKGTLNADTLLEAFSKIEFPLGPNGEIDLSNFKLVCAPSAQDRMKAAMLEIENIPEKKRRLEEIMQQKKEAALAREADRKLVE